MSSRRPINVEVYPKKNEPIERTIKRFSKKIKKERIIEEFKENMYYEKPSEVKRRTAKRRKNTIDRAKEKDETT
jgi:small subunit ribosomal protein S21